MTPSRIPDSRQRRAVSWNRIWASCARRPVWPTRSLVAGLRCTICHIVQESTEDVELNFVINHLPGHPIQV